MSNIKNAERWKNEFIFPAISLRYYRRTAAPIENRKKGGESEIVKCQIGPMFRSLNFAARGSKWRVK